MAKLSKALLCFSCTLTVLCVSISSPIVLGANKVISTNPSSAAAMPTKSSKLPLMPAPPTIDATSYILIDAASGDVIAEKDADAHLPPASLTKMMTLYLIFQALQHQQIQLDTPVPISVKAWRMGGSKMFVREGTEVSVDKLIRGIIVDSGNDASVAMAEYLGGSEDNFVNMMNQQAQLLGMTHTHFTDSTGMPHDDHYSSAKDLALLARALVQHFPEYYHYFAQKSMTYNNIKQHNRNRLLWRTNLGADGLKTGHTEEAGYCLVSSAKQGDQRLIAVVTGTPSDNARTQNSAALLNYGFRFFETHQLYPADTAISQARIWQGQVKQIGLGIAQPVYVTIPRGQYNKLTANMLLTNTLRAPIERGQAVGELQILLNNQPLTTYPIVALSDSPKGGLWRRLIDSVGLHWHNWFSKNTDTAQLAPQANQA